MSITTLLVLVVVLAFGVGHLATRYLTRRVALSGVEYLVIGAVLGPVSVPRILTSETLVLLDPFISLILGLVGFNVGLSARAQIRSAEAAGVGALSGLGVLLGVAGCFLALTDALIPASAAGDTPLWAGDVTLYGSWAVEFTIRRELALVALVIGAAASVSSAALLEAGNVLRDASGRVTNLVRGAACASQLLAVAVFGLVLALVRATDEANRFGIGVAEWSLAAASSGVVCGLLFTLFIGREKDVERVFLASVGAVILASGIGAALGISPLFVNLIAGLIVSATSSHAATTQKNLERLRHPLFVLLMIFAGAMWAPVSGRLWLCPAAYLVLRTGLKRLWTAAAGRSVLEEKDRVPRLGDGMLMHGTLAVAIGVSFAQRDTALGPLVLTTVVLGTLATDIWATKPLRRLLVDEGELAPDSTQGSSPPLGESS